MRYKIESYSQFQKDSESKAILNVDKNALSAYKAHRTNIKKAMDVSNEIENLKLDVQEIKSLLHQLINNR
jgi:hypothetical protein